MQKCLRAGETELAFGFFIYQVIQEESLPGSAVCFN